MYVRNHFKCVEVNLKSTQDLESIIVSIVLSPQMSFTVAGLYRPPNSTKIFYDKLKSVLKEIGLKTELIVLGDFNINWMEKAKRHQLKSIADQYNLTQMILGPTRVTQSTRTQIDLIFSNKPERITKCYNLVTGMSDHNLTLIVRKLTKQRFLYKQEGKSFFNIIPKSLVGQFEEKLKHLDWNDVLQSGDIENAFNTMMDRVNNTKNEFSKNVSYSNKINLPWLNEHLWKLMKQRDLALKAALKSKLPHDKRKFQDLRNKVVKELRQAKADYFIKLIDDSKGNSKLIWKNIDKITKKEHKAVHNWAIKDQSKLIEDKEQIAKIFNSFFLNSAQCLAMKFGVRSGALQPINDETPVFTIENVPESTVLKIFDNLKGSRSKDVYDIDARFFKTYKSSLCKPLTHLINLSITNSYFPSCWKAAVVIPIFKAGDRTLPSNYRPISILPIASKIAERVVCDQLVSHLNESEVNLHPMQFGFRKNHSTETANCFFVEQIRSQLDKGGVVGAVFLDLAKAFDTVNHNCLISKLQNFN